MIKPCYDKTLSSRIDALLQWVKPHRLSGWEHARLIHGPETKILVRHKTHAATRLIHVRMKLAIRSKCSGLAEIWVSLLRGNDLVTELSRRINSRIYSAT